MSSLAVIYVILLFIFSFLFLVDCIRYRKRLNLYVKYGLLYGVILVGLDGAFVLLNPVIMELVPAYKLVILDVVALVRIAIFTCMGMYCCALLNCPDLPLTRRILARSEVPGKVVTNSYLASIAGVVIGGVAFSYVLFTITAPQVSKFLRELSELGMTRTGVSDRPTITLAVIALQFAFAEEIIFRLGIQNYLARQFNWRRGRYWISIFITAGFWSLAHANTLDPEWVKIAQVFPLGVGLGALSRKFGVESSIFAHGAFNMIMMFFARDLITI